MLFDYGTPPPDTFLEMARGGIALDSDQTASTVARTLSVIGGASVAGGVLGAAAATGAFSAAAATIFPFAARAGSLTAVAVGGAASVAATVVAAAIIAGFALADVIKIETYEGDLKQALQDARQPVTFNDLKALMATETGSQQLFAYQVIQAAQALR